MKAVRRSLRALAVSGLVLTAGVGAQAGRAPHTDAAGKYVVGYDVATLTNPFFQGMTKGVVDTVAKYPDLTLDNTNANNDANTQTNVVLDLINKHVNALILNPINANAIVSVVKQANKKGIPVFTLDRGAACGSCQVNFLETDNVALGREGADYIASRLRARYGKIRGNVVDLEGLLGTTAGDEREAGFTGEFSKLAKANPGLKLIARQEAKFDPDVAFSAMTNIMTANKQIDAVFNGNDDNAVGAERAIKQAGRFAPIGSSKHIIIIGIDGTGQALAAIRNGQQDATLSQNPLTMAAQSVKYVEMYLHGEKSRIPQHQYWPHILLDKANLNSPAVQKYGLWGDQVANGH